MKAMKNLKVWQIWFSLIAIFICGLVVNAEDGKISTFKQWKVVGPTGGDIREIKIDPKNKNHLFASTLDGQIHASYDAGNNWQLLVNFNRPGLILDNLIIDSRDSNIIYTSGHRHKQPGGFFKTTDGGKTWKESRELRSSAIHALVQSSRDPNMLLAGTVKGVWVSRDSGDTWSEFKSSTTPVTLDALAIDPRDTNTIYAGTWYRAYKTTDGGKNWRLVKKGMIDDSDVFAIDIDPINPDHVIASACSGIYQSLDRGETWKKVQGIPSQARRTRAILINPAKPSQVYAGTTEGFWMSSNGGTSWSLTSSRNIEINSIAVHPSEPNKIYIGTNNYGVMVSTDGGRNFGVKNGNFSSRRTYNIKADVERPNRFYATTINTATGGGAFFVSDDFGRTWKFSARNIDTNRTLIHSIIQDKVNPNIIYLGTNTGVYKSINRGLSWNKLKAPKAKRVYKRRSRRSRRRSYLVKPPKLPNGGVYALTRKVEVMTHTNDGKNGYLAGTVNGLYRSYNVSKSWEKINLGVGVKDNIYAVHASPKTPNTIWVGTVLSGLFVSRDNGATWSKVNQLPTRVPVRSIATNPDNPNLVYVGTIQTFYMSQDGGRTWQRRGRGLPLGNFKSILFNPKNAKEMFVASSRESDGGIFHSTDAGLTWKRVDSKQIKLPTRRIWSLMFNPSDSNQLLAGTHSSGVYRIDRKFIAKDEVVKKAAKPKVVIKTVKSDGGTRSRISGSK